MGGMVVLATLALGCGENAMFPTTTDQDTAGFPTTTGQDAVFLTTIDPNGTPLSTFDVGLASDQFVPFVKVDASGNIWVARNDVTHSINAFNPNDMVVKFTPTGAVLLTVKGPMRSPSSIAFDPSGNIYIGGIPDGGSLSASQIYKYDSNGNFLTSFGLLTGPLLGADWNGLVLATGDRLFGTTGNPHSVQEFSVSGTHINSTGSFDGTLRIGRSLALTPGGNTLWNYQPKNGPGEDFIVEYDLNLNVISSFGLDPLGNPFLYGLNTLANGNIVTRDAFNSQILEMSPNGTLVNAIDVFAIDQGLGFRRGFAVDGDENFLITHLAPLAQTVVIDIKPGSDPNSINTKSKGVIPVAILGGTDFDVRDVDVTTLTFGPSDATPAHEAGGHFEDVNDDGFGDLVSHYRTQDAGLNPGDTEACVDAATMSGTPIHGCDAVRIVK